VRFPQGSPSRGTMPQLAPILIFKTVLGPENLPSDGKTHRQSVDVLPPAARAPTEDPVPGQGRPEDQRLAAALCHPGRLRGHCLGNGPRSWPAPLPLPRPGKDACPARAHSRRPQHRPTQRMLPARHHTGFSTTTGQSLPAALPKTHGLEITNSIRNCRQSRFWASPSAATRLHTARAQAGPLPIARRPPARPRRTERRARGISLGSPPSP
jgi:hypothetical protein